MAVSDLFQSGPPFPLFLAPMEDVTDIGFRRLCKRFGASMVYTEFVSAEALVRSIKSTVNKLAISDEERPVGIQIYGRDVEAMVEAARIVEQAHPDVIDLNFGCPVKKVAGKGAGAGMLQNIMLPDGSISPDAKLLEITRKVVDAVRVPVTAKTRLGWNHEQLCITALAEQLQDCGIQALTIHGRTRSQMYKGEADWTLIGAVKDNPRMKIPIIGNGDINSAARAREAFDRYGVDGVMVGRASFGHPWIFTEIRHLLDTGSELPPMSVRDRVALAKRHLQLSLDLKGPVTGVYEMRRHLSCYFKGLRDFKDTRIRLVTSKDPAEIMATLDYIADRWGAEAPEAEGVYGL